MFSTQGVPAGFLLFSKMSEETESSPEISPEPANEAPPRARKAATPRARKAAKPAVPVAEVAANAPEAIPAPPQAVEAETPVQKSPSVEEQSSQTGGDWPESEGESAGGGQGQTESGKRKRRRRKGKGQSSQVPAASGASNEDSQQPVANAESKPADAPRDQGPRPNQQQPQPRPKIDPEDLAKMAWKIYLAEVSEEGVALIGDNDAKDLARRCFRLAEIFIEEQARRR